MRPCNMRLLPCSLNCLYRFLQYYLSITLWLLHKIYKNSTIVYMCPISETLEKKIQLKSRSMFISNKFFYLPIFKNKSYTTAFPNALVIFISNITVFVFCSCCCSLCLSSLSSLSLCVCWIPALDWFSVISFLSGPSHYRYPTLPLLIIFLSPAKLLQLSLYIYLHTFIMHRYIHIYIHTHSLSECMCVFLLQLVDFVFKQTKLKRNIWRMSGRRSRQQSSGISDDQIIELVSKLHQLLPQIHNSARSNKVYIFIYLYLYLYALIIISHILFISNIA